MVAHTSHLLGQALWREGRGGDWRKRSLGPGAPRAGPFTSCTSTPARVASLHTAAAQVVCKVDEQSVFEAAAMHMARIGADIVVISSSNLCETRPAHNACRSVWLPESSHLIS